MDGCLPVQLQVVRVKYLSYRKDEGDNGKPGEPFLKLMGLTKCKY
jgi:hypothetical protein